MEAMEALHEIVAADRRAREAFDEAQRRNQAFDGNLDILRRDAKNKALAQARREVKAARDKALADAQSAMEGLEEQYRRDLAALTERVQAARETATERMFRMVIGLDD